MEEMFAQIGLRAGSRMIYSANFCMVEVPTLGKKSISRLFPWTTSYVTIAIALIIAEVGFVDALSFTIVVAIQTLGGVLILSVMNGGRIEPTAECVGLGFALGSLFSTISEQTLLGTVISGFAWLLPVVFGFVLHFFGRRSKVRTKYFSISAQTSDGHLLMPSAVVGVCFSLGLEWYWTLPIGAVLLPVFFVPEIKRKSSRIRLPVYGLWVFVSVATLIFVLRHRPKIWWIEHTFDYVLFENWSNSISRFGSTGIGGEGFEFNYHWLSYAWNGLVSRVSLSEPWVATTRASVFVVALGIQLLLAASMRNYGLSTRAANGMATIAGLISTAPLWRYDSMHLLHLESFSAVFALVWLLAAFLVALKLRESYSGRYSILFLIFCGATMGAKTAFGAVALAMIFALTIEKFFTRDPRVRAFIFLSGASAVVVALIAIFLFYDRFLPKIWGPHIGYIDFLGAMESENLLLRKPELTLLASWWISAGLLLQIFAVVVFCIRKNSDLKFKVLFEPLLLFFSLIALLVISFWDGNQNYFAYAAFVILLPVTFQVVLSELRFIRLTVLLEARNFGKILASIFVAVALPIGVRKFPEVGVATRTDVIVRHVPYLTTFLALITTTLFCISISRKRLDQGRRLLASFGVWTLLLSSVSFYFSEWSNEVGKTYDRWTRESVGKIEQLYGSKETAEVIAWVNANTDPDSIVAFDYDLGDCQLDPWQIVESKCPSESAVSDSGPVMSREVFEGAIRRRALLRNIHPLAFGRDLTMDSRLKEIEFRRQNIISYARNGDPASLEFLRDQSVDWFIASGRNSTITNWGRGTQVKFKNKDYVVVRLGKSDN